MLILSYFEVIEGHALVIKVSARDFADSQAIGGSFEKSFDFPKVSEYHPSRP